MNKYIWLLLILVGTALHAADDLSVTAVTAAGTKTLARAAIGTVIGTDVQAWSANGDAWSMLAPSAKQDALGFTAVPNTRSISTTSPLTGGGDLSANRTFAIPVATSSVSGYLTSTDWTTFNSKASALGFTPVNVAGDTMTGSLTVTALTNSALTASRATVTDANKAAASSATTATELGYVSGVTSAIQTQLNTKAVSATTLSGYGITDGALNTRSINTTAPITGGGNLTADRTIAIAASTDSVDGYLTASDHTAFNAKQAALGFTAVPNTRTISTTAPLTGGGDLSADRTFAMAAATDAVNGYLTAADHTTFNAKQSALTFGSGLTNKSGTVTNNIAAGTGISLTAGSGGIITIANTASGTSGTVINTGASSVSNVPRYTDTTGTNIAPSGVSIASGASGSLTGGGNITAGQFSALSWTAGAAIKSSANNAIELTDNTGNSPAKVRLGVYNLTKTANYTVTATDSGTFFDNIGASGGINFTLPTAARGLTYTFIVQAAQNLTVTAGASTTIRRAASVTAAAGNIVSNTPGAVVHIVAISTTEWYVVSIDSTTLSNTGSWTFN